MVSFQVRYCYDQEEKDMKKKSLLSPGFEPTEVNLSVTKFNWITKSFLIPISKA